VTVKEEEFILRNTSSRRKIPLVWGEQSRGVLAKRGNSGPGGVGGKTETRLRRPAAQSISSGRGAQIGEVAKGGTSERVGITLYTRGSVGKNSKGGTEKQEKERVAGIFSTRELVFLERGVFYGRISQLRSKVT